MAVSTQTLIDKTETAISDLLDALAGDAVQSYTFQGRTYMRADFPRTLDSLYRQRETLRAQLARETSNPVRVARFGAPRGVER